MENIGLDLHQRESQLCILTDDGEVIERRLRTTPERLTAVLGPRAPARILLEASTESEWVARHLEALGHTVIVADPNYAPMYATRSARVKTDRRDARTLAHALRLQAYRPAHRSADRHRHVRAELAVRDTLVRTRTRDVPLTKALVRREGFRLASGAAEHTRAKLAASRCPPCSPPSWRRWSRSCPGSTRRSPRPMRGSRSTWLATRWCGGSRRARALAR
jgi:transposase